jgi:RNA polymerase sigma factor (sigma-70 family)
MDDLLTDDLLGDLRSADPREGWARFLQHYSPLVLDVIHRFEREPDAVGDCYIFVCEHLSRDGFRRLLRFRPNGPARFSTWLYAVVRNLCLDWHRQERGRHRVFECVSRMPALEQEVFRCLFLDEASTEFALLELGPRFSGLTAESLDAAAERVRQSLTPRQHWLLAARRCRGLAVTSLEEDERAPARMPADEGPDPEMRAALREEREAVIQGLSRLPPGDRLLVRLRFERNLTLVEIGRLLDLGGPQAADRRIREVLGKLRAFLEPSLAGSGKASVPSV